MDRNHAKHEDRLTFIRSLLFARYNLEVASSHISPVDSSHPMQSGCVVIPHGETDFILRLTNPDSIRKHQKYRVENEVAMIELTSVALKNFQPSIVPSVYGWGSAASEASQGWILQNVMPGTPLDTAMDSMEFTDKKTILSQMADILAALQRYGLPPSITGFGGLTFDREGHVMSAPLINIGSGPWSSYEASFRERLCIALQKSEENFYIRGWHFNGVRKRLDAFLHFGVPKQFQHLTSREDKVIVHADINTSNMLYEPSTKTITALLDYDLGSISHPSHEFLRSFDGHGGRFRGWSGDKGSDDSALRNAVLHGFPSPLPPTSENGVQWEIAKVWEDALEKSQAQRPSTIAGIEQVADVDAIISAIVPWCLTDLDSMRLMSYGDTLDCKEECEKLLVEMLDRLGY